MKKRNLLEIRGTALVGLTALISGVAIVINRFFVTQIDPLLFTAIRAFFIGLIFLIISVFVSSSNSKKTKKSSWTPLISIGLIGGGLAFWLFFAGLRLTTAGRAAFLHKTLPIYAVIFGYVFLKEKITKKQLTVIGIMLIGLVFLELNKLSFDMRIGDLLVLGATILWAVENTIAKKVMLEKENNWVVSFARMFFGSLLLLSIIFLTGNSSLLFSLNPQQIIYITISTVFLFLYVLTWYWGLKYINLSKASTILLISPVISLLLGFFWLNEEIFLLQLAGSILILIGAYIMLGIKSEKRKNHATSSIACA